MPTPEEIGRETARRLAEAPEGQTVAEAARAVDVQALIESAGENASLDDIWAAAARADAAMGG
jgi:hypothetical protein